MAGGGVCPRGLRNLRCQKPSPKDVLPSHSQPRCKSSKASEEPLFAPNRGSITSLQGHGANTCNGATL